jgi:hypothetical protein
MVAWEVKLHYGGTCCLSHLNTKAAASSEAPVSSTYATRRCQSPEDNNLNNQQEIFSEFTDNSIELFEDGSISLTEKYGLNMVQTSFSVSLP